VDKSVETVDKSNTWSTVENPKSAILRGLRWHFRALELGVGKAKFGKYVQILYQVTKKTLSYVASGFADGGI